VEIVLTERKKTMKLKLSVTLLGTVIALGSVSRYAVAGAVYTMSNSSTANAVLLFNRSSDGQLSPAGIFPTGGRGSGGGLGNQGGLAIDDEKGLLFAVNAGSNSISVFRITEDGLQLENVAGSNGIRPISVTVNHKILYVLNNGAAVGGSDSIAGFKIGKNGELSSIISEISLSAPSVGPAQIGFNADGDVLMVTEKNTNKIDLFSVDNVGVASGPQVVASAGNTPFGFAFGKRDQVFVSDAFGGAANAGAVSSYKVTGEQGLETIVPVANDKQSAPCWVVVTNDGRFTYTTNTGSGTISGYRIGFDGSLRLLNEDGETAETGKGSTPIDAALTNNSRFLYVLTPGSQSIQGFDIASDGALSPITQASGIPSSANGLVAR
jgi:6-phosphogluconolactonase (cycloisomerase 2 family)